MRYKSIEEAQQDHIKNYRSDGLKKGKGTRYSPDYYRVKFIVDKVPENSKVLDVGCNTGVISIRLKDKDCHVKAIDIVQDLVDKAKWQGIFAEQGTAEDLSRYHSDTFDVVVCSEVLEHLFDPLPAMKEAYRVLKPGGKYLVTVPHPDSCMNESLGDYHQTNFSGPVIDTLFKSVFPKKDQCFVWNIPYIPEYCEVNNVDPNRPQWLGLECTK